MQFVICQDLGACGQVRGKQGRNQIMLEVQDHQTGVTREVTEPLWCHHVVLLNMGNGELKDLVKFFQHACPTCLLKHSHTNNKQSHVLLELTIIWSAFTCTVITPSILCPSTTQWQ